MSHGHIAVGGKSHLTQLAGSERALIMGEIITKAIKKFMRHAFRRDVAAKNILCSPAAICQVCDEKKPVA